MNRVFENLLGFVLYAVIVYYIAIILTPVVGFIYGLIEALK